MQPFVHLHTHTEYSLVDGISRISDIMARAEELHMPAVAITDHGNMCGAVYFYKAAKAKGIKPILGCEIYVTEGSRFEKPANTGRKRGERLHHLVLLAENNQGYENLVKIVSKAALEGFYYKPRADRELIAQHSEGLIALSACIQGSIPSAIIEGDMEKARELIAWHIDTFGKENFFLEIQDHGIDKEVIAQKALIDLAAEYGIGLVCTNDFHYVRREDAGAHDIKLCISMGHRKDDIDRFRFPNDEFYMKSGDEMRSLFQHVPEAIENTLRIAERCNVELDFSTYHLPQFSVPEGHTARSYLRALCEAGIASRYGETFPELEERLNYELSVIEKMGFEDYFLIVWDYIDYSRRHGILVGPGRGSGAGSIVAYLLGITGLDPLKYHLLFERFLNPERISMPDFDIDFCYERRPEAIDYVVRKYGADRVAQIITFGTEGARAVIRDVGRVLDVPLAEVNRVAKLIPNELGITLTKALEDKDLKALYDADPTVQEMFSYGMQLEGIARNTSIHAAGIVIAASPLDSYVPLQRSADAFAVTQYDKDNVEQLGFLKMDFLGLRTLTVMADALKLIKENRGIDLDLDALPLDDTKTCDLLCQGDTAGVFQLESEGITKLVKDLQPRHFEDLIPLVALYRPGPLGSGMVADFISRRHGRTEVTYLDPVLEPILKDTFGVILYQEQVMQIASAMGGFSLGRADVLRRAMGKKKEKELIATRDEFLAGCRSKGFSESVANEVFDLILYFAGYGFNKSHSAAYAYIAYQTAYLKAHYYPEFMAATMTSFMARLDKLAFYIYECRRHDVPILGPSVNASERTFSVEGNAIRFGLGAIKTVGERPVEEILHQRSLAGPFASFDDFCRRITGSEINKRNIEGLIRCGALDGLGLNRRQLLLTYEQVHAMGLQWQKNEAMGTMSLFEDDVPGVTAVAYPEVEDLTMDEKLKDERNYLGFYMSGHPLQSYEQDLAQLFSLGKIMGVGDDGNTGAEFYDGQRVTIGGIVTSRTDRLTKNNDKMTILRIEDFAGAVDVVIFPKLFQKVQAYVQVDGVLKIRGRVDADDRGVQIVAEEVAPLHVDYTAVRGVTLHIFKKYDTPAASKALQECLQKHKGGIPVRLWIEKTGRYVNVPSHLHVTVDAEAVRDMEAILGPHSVELV